MKTSSIIFVAAGLLLFGSIVWYDMLLKANYDTGLYKQPYSSYAILGFSGFDRVNIVGSTASNVKFIQGPFSVKIDEYARAYTNITQTGRDLVINSAFEHNYKNNPNDYIIIISCPVLRQVSTGATYMSNGSPFTDSVVRPDWVMRSVLVEGFHQDSFIVRQDYGSTLILSKNKFAVMSATSGVSPGSGSRIEIRDDNQLGVARIDVRHKSQLFLENAPIADFSYRLSDQGILTVTGNAQHLLTTIKPWQE